MRRSPALLAQNSLFKKNAILDNNFSGHAPRTQKNVQHQPEEKNRPLRPTAWWKVSFVGIFTGLVGISYYQYVKILPAFIAIILSAIVLTNIKFRR
ncbi:hypothetical protein [Proteiniphilum sp.]|uniref:hypothetical protein n=1 Tax=Proteiniphilum sp. TaxID=1926877 RepID=UPI002B1F81B5|nr:hypothetical protein [Proteiniphilum sp.]MEA4918969.1 hypothetical protein [Proteiniphilum sp.]